MVAPSPNVALTAMEYTDENWANGINRSQPMFLLQNTLSNRANFHAGITLRFRGSGVRRVVNVQPNDDFLNVAVDSPLDAASDGYPAPIDILD